MHAALNEILAALPGDTKVYVRDPLGHCSRDINKILTSDSLAMNTQSRTSSSLPQSSRTRRLRDCNHLLKTIRRRKGSSQLEMKRYVYYFGRFQGTLDNLYAAT